MSLNWIGKLCRAAFALLALHGLAACGGADGGDTASRTAAWPAVPATVAEQAISLPGTEGRKRILATQGTI